MNKQYRYGQKCRGGDYRLAGYRTQPKRAQITSWPRLFQIASVPLVLLAVVVGTSSMGNGAGTMSRPNKPKASPVSTTAIAASVTSKPKEVAKGTSATASVAVVNTAHVTPIQASSPSWTNLSFYTDPTNEATTYYQSNPTVNGADIFRREGLVPVANWIGDWTVDVRAEVDRYVSAASAQNQIPVLVLYSIPNRDCGGYSAGGLASDQAYQNWIASVVNGMRGRTTVLILEPDALSSMDCLTSAQRQARYDSLAKAIGTLKANTKATVYLDAGNPLWQSVDTMAQRLNAAGIAGADGFSLNVANFISIAKNQQYGDALSSKVGNKHYVIDTARNGNSSVAPTDWCNPASAALGHAPSTSTGNGLNDAFIWVKIPWESDGACNGGPAAGMVYWSYALNLAANAGW